MSEIHWDYRTYAQIIEDVHSWCERLPLISAVAGIPRSGMFPASLIAQRRAIPLLSIEAVLFGTPPRPTKYNKTRTVQGPVLIVDDTHWTGDSMERHREELRGGDFIFGAVYAHTPFGHLDTWAIENNNPWSTYEYNFMRQGFTDHYIVSIDAIRSASGRPNHLLPSFPVLSIACDHTLEATDWLNRNGVRRVSVVQARDSLEKASLYTSRSEATLFVEFSEAEANQIHARTGRPVFSTEAMRVIQGEKP